MAIVKMNKFTLFAFEKDKEALLKNLQKFQGVHFVNLESKLENEEMKFLEKTAADKQILEIENELSKIKFAFDFLSPYIEKKGVLQSLKEGKKTITFEELDESVKKIDWQGIYRELRTIEEKRNSLINEKSKLELEIENLLPWKNFDAKFEELKELKFSTSFLGSIPKDLKDKFTEEFERELNYSYVEIINEGRDETYVLVLMLKEEKNKTLDILKKYGFAKALINYNGNPQNIIQDYDKRIKEIEREIKEIASNTKKLNKYMDDIELLYEYYSNELNRAKASLNFLNSHTIVVIQGWNTVDSNNKLEEVIKEVAGDYYYLEFEDAKEDDEVPILLKNNSFVEPFENIVEMYSLPNYGEVDPTPIMSVFYAVFFGMMLSDAAYGVLLVIGTAIALMFFKLNKAMRNNMKLFLFLGISTIFWGGIYGSWFGDAPISLFGAKSIPKLLDPANSIIEVMVLSLALGGIHIFAGLGMKAYLLIRDKKYIDALFDVGFWYITLIGGILMLVGVMPSISKWMLYGGLIALFLTQGRDAKTIVGKLGGGLYGVYGITSYIGDFVSYSRLLALGLATGFIGNAFNIMINLLPGAAKFIVGPIIFIIGHLFNMGINALGAYVHANRLQYLEFFGKFYEGGGKTFKPLRAQSKYFEIVNEK
ncbi:MULTISPECIES: V-type ATP synthase subunit I [Clostridium]|uniref:V-type ATP synthase subunit I n=2 Tax=Clostridium TaxID=1485 RepID=A0A151ARU8_9CLOT|nr:MULTISPECIES: V-type ATP synthase subunit I [Clostridium]KYH30312.1 V-type ATP synthase subunit I [Clostridium colicanis DSM 13634]MBE6044465.1 V-type ATP synthase subunit I [Clostridium thermopalmarium]PRR69426.1 V-type ATP synthase subunit I [Clostridium thermopalmarium DSM 5974]PVZ26308.1 V/A-type H+-transporting ATPase subunit I [Clostridium thermopalmarium DSM 5974]